MEKELLITSENLEDKQQELLQLAIEICRSQKFIRMKQKAYDSLDYAIYKYYQSQQNKQHEPGNFEENK